PRLIAWWEALTALSKAGMVAVPGTTLLTAKDIAYRLDACDAAGVIIEASGIERVEAALAETGRQLTAKIAIGTPGDAKAWHDWDQLLDAAAPAHTPIATPANEPALLYFTSGTTAHPKMVLHSHASYGIGHRVTGEYWLNLSPGQVHWNVSDTGWAKAAWSS